MGTGSGGWETAFDQDASVGFVFKSYAQQEP